MQNVYWGVLLGVTVWETEGSRNGWKEKMGYNVITLALEAVLVPETAVHYVGCSGALMTEKGRGCPHYRAVTDVICFLSREPNL